MQIKILGNGGAFDEISTSYLINNKIMVDCGQSVVNSLINNDFESKTLDKLEHLFITHTHSDHINGLESLLYYKSIKNNFKFIENFTIYGTEEVLNYYKSLAFSQNPLEGGAYYQPFTFKLLHKNYNSSILVEDCSLHVNYIKAYHMNGTLNALSFIFVNLHDVENKIIITGDIDNINKLISPNLINKKTLLFHDMGWTGLPKVENKYKFHPTENEVFNYYGKNENIIGIHTSKILKYYKKAKLNKTYII